MSKYTNLNITDRQKRTFKYIVEYEDVPTLSRNYMCYTVDQDSIYIKDVDLLKKKNHWINTNTPFSNKYVPQFYNISKFRIYFPEFSVDTYSNNMRYILSISTWINGKTIYLCNKLLNRLDAIAPRTGVKIFLNNRYYECIEIDCIDPFYITYEDEWKEFREGICGEKVGMNNTGSNINVQLYVVQQSDDGWIKSQEYTEAQGAILLTNPSNNSLRCDIDTNIKQSILGDPISFNVGIHFNNIYLQDDSGLEEYLQETYLLDTDKIKTVFNLIVKDQNNVYKYISHEYNTLVQCDTFDKRELKLTWDEYIEGLEVSCIVLFYNKDNDDEILGLTSNVLFFNQDIYKFFVGNNVIDYVNLDDVNMLNYNINAVNKIEQKIINIERPDSYKANIQKPVFIRTQDVRQITIHPAVTENIVINLDSYKSKVNTFLLKIGGMVFPEIGRVSAGVIFKIVGPKLEKEITDGVYYILDNEQEMVTSGKYIAVS